MSRRQQSVVTLDPIDRRNKKRPGVIGRLFITRRYRGKPMKKTEPFGHYLFVGVQRHGKTTSAIWYRDELIKKYHKRGKKVILFDNIGLGGIPVRRSNFHLKIASCEYNENTIYIFLIDELQAWYPKDTKDPETLRLIDILTGQFSQLGKRQIYVLTTAQIFGRVNKNLREQCLYMVHCRPSAVRHKCVNDFIPGEDIICDDLGRWSGNPQKVLIHGVPETKFNTHLMVELN